MDPQSASDSAVLKPQAASIRPAGRNSASWDQLSLENVSATFNVDAADEYRALANVNLKIVRG